MVIPNFGQKVVPAERGRKLFSDKEYVLHELPDFLKETCYMLDTMSGEKRFVPVTTGTIMVVTPLAGMEGSQEENLIAQGFVRIECGSFKLFEEQFVEIGVFKKDVQYEKFRLMQPEYSEWGLTFFKQDSLPSITEPAEIIGSPGKTYAKNKRMWQGCPSIELTGNRLWAGWFSGGKREPDEGNYGIVSYQDKDGNWLDPVMIIHHPNSEVRVMDTQLWKDSIGRLWVFWVQNTGTKGFDGIWGTWCIRIDDPESENPTWTEPRRLCNGLTRNKPTVLSSGEWLLPSYDWINHQSAVYISRDQGDNWSLQGGPLNKPISNFYEHMCVELKNGKIWMLQRNVQESFSDNKGKDWTNLNELPNINSANSRVYLGRLRSGNLLFVYNDSQSSKERKNLTAMLSTDEGKTWPYRLVLDHRSDVSYPDVTQGKDGLIYLCYDRSRRGEKEILMAVFTEKDIIGGKFLSPKSEKRMLISKVMD